MSCFSIFAEQTVAFFKKKEHTQHILSNVSSSKFDDFFHVVFIYTVSFSFLFFFKGCFFFSTILFYSSNKTLSSLSKRPEDAR